MGAGSVAHGTSKSARRRETSKAHPAWMFWGGPLRRRVAPKLLWLKLLWLWESSPLIRESALNIQMGLTFGLEKGWSQASFSLQFRVGGQHLPRFRIAAPELQSYFCRCTTSKMVTNGSTMLTCTAPYCVPSDQVNWQV